MKEAIVKFKETTGKCKIFPVHDMKAVKVQIKLRG